MAKKAAHPYHYSQEKNTLQVLIDWLVPGLILFGYYQFYNFGKINPSEMVKTSGLMAITLLSLTLIIGPLTKLIPSLESLKSHRKLWGLLSFLFLFIHLLLVVNFYMKWNLLALINPANPKFPGLFTGVLAFIILLIVSLTSNKTAIKSLDPKVWKLIQTTSYLALILAVAHFYLMEQVNGVLVIKRDLGKITFGFAVVTVVARLLSPLIPKIK